MLLINLKEIQMNAIRFERAPAVSKDNILSFLTRKKKARYNLSSLYNSLNKELRKLNRFNDCHLTTYPYIGVHVVNRDATYLMNNQAEIKEAVESLLWDEQQ